MPLYDPHGASDKKQDVLPMHAVVKLAQGR